MPANQRANAGIVYRANAAQVDDEMAITVTEELLETALEAVGRAGGERLLR